jgi:serine/threonine protein kinase/tetratricopeptide (TPR) repeat protein
MATSPDRWKTVKEWFEAALEEDAAHRSSFLKERCPDASLRAEVERLLAEHEQAGGFLSTPAFGDLSFESESPAPMQGLSEGDVLAGRFRIVRFIAGGGMGEVYEAEDQELRERVAVKTIRQEIIAQPDAVARFKREVHLARKVTHPNVCRIFDLFRHRPSAGGVQGETFFISMELLQGETLGARLKAKGRVNVGEALPLVKQMASALTAAHTAGIVHRDFKPGNVVLVGVPGQQGERAVVTDFGLALRSLTSDETASLPTGQGLLGTPAYMSPEQIEGRPATAASDIYALGLVIYEMVTGAKPFQGDTPISAALKRLSETPTSPRKFDPGLSMLWESVILRCLERDPAQRFPNAEEVAGALVGGEPAFSSIAARKAAKRQKTALLAGALLIVAMVMVGGGLYFRAYRSNRLTGKDTIVLADFANSTGDPIFDDTLKTALNISLQQSPFLNILSESKATKTLKLMMRPSNTKLTPDVVRDLCRRAESKAYVAGSITSLGSQYVLALKAVNCQSGDLLTEEQGTAGAKEKVLDTLGKLASKLRRKLGESLATVQNLDVPLSEATTPSLEALQAYSLGQKVNHEKGAIASLPYDRRAIELDPNFAIGYQALGFDYYGIAEIGRASEYFTKAFQLCEHASELEKLAITAAYYDTVAGELDKAAQTYQEWIASYPRDIAAHNDLANVYVEQGQYEKAFEAYRETMRSAPDNVGLYGNISVSLLSLQRFNEARQTIEEAQARKLDNVTLRNSLYALAFLRGDSSGMAEEQQWSQGKPEENMGLALASDTEAYAGHLGKARALTSRSVDSAIRSDSKENGAIWLENAALREAAFGKLTDAKQAAAQGLQMVPASLDVEVEAALALAMAGDVQLAESLEQSLNKHYPFNTQVQSLWLPAIRAQLALNRKEVATAIRSLQPAFPPIEYGMILFLNNGSCLYPTYIRGKAYLAAGQGSAAAAEFQKILDHSGIVWNCWTGALARLGIARANALQSRTSQGADADAARIRSLAAYKDFLTLWKDADPDIPMLKEAKAEYGELR